MKSSFLKVLKAKNFLKIWISQIFSQFTVNLLNFVLILKIFQNTHSTVAVSLFWFFWALPAIFLGPFSGTIIDYFGTRKILVLTNLFQSLVVLFYLAIKTSVWPIYTTLLFYSLLNQFYLPAEASTLPATVNKKLLPAANSLFLFTVYASLILGYGFAGFIIKLFGEQFPFILGSLMLILAAFAVWLLPQQNFSRRVSKKHLSSLPKFFNKIKEGYSFIKSNPGVLLPLILLVFSQIILSIIAVLAPALVVKILKTDLLNVGERFILPIGFGGVIGMIITVRLLQKVRKIRLINIGYFLLSASLFALVLLVPHFWGILKIFAELLFSFFSGFAFSLFTLPIQTLLQEKTPDNLRGRVFGVLGFMITSACVIPVIFSATIGEFLGELWMILILATAILAAGLFTFKGKDVVWRYYRS